MLGWGFSSQTTQRLLEYPTLVPWGLKRYQQARDLHFVTFSCYRRLPLLQSAGAKRRFELALEQTRPQYGFWVTGYVIMPEHVHLLMSEPDRATLAVALQALKQSMARRLIGNQEHFWQARYYDFNVYTTKKRVEKPRYMHRNPVKRGLVQEPQDWPWSSFRRYLTGEEGVVEIESEWTGTKREWMGMSLRVKLVGMPVTFGTSEEKTHPSKRSSDGAPAPSRWQAGPPAPRE
ncbi:MAG: transposase [Candidatus Korobacteraceae bacterium]